MDAVTKDLYTALHISAKEGQEEVRKEEGVRFRGLGRELFFVEE